MQYLPGFAVMLMQWYEINKRDLPWRRTQDPFKIWLSEVIMQQTKVQQGLPYYETFIRTFQSVQDLANTPEDVILRLWQGLGYYSRARNMHEAAKQITYYSAGKFPDNFNDLLKLKGVGRYTAAAIASFAFGEKVPVVDGNVLRVMTRIFGIEEDITMPATVKKIEALALNHISAEDPGTYNQAIMEFGALYCTPGKPDCKNCIFSHSCFAFRNQLVSKLPLKINKVKVKSRFFNYILFKYGSHAALKQRACKDIWNGLYEFYLIESDKLLVERELSLLLTEILKEEINFREVSETYIHVLTHQKIQARFLVAEVISKERLENLGFRFYSGNEIEILAKPVLILKYINNYFL